MRVSSETRADTVGLFLAVFDVVLEAEGAASTRDGRGLLRLIEYGNGIVFLYVFNERMLRTLLHAVRMPQCLSKTYEFLVLRLLHV